MLDSFVISLMLDKKSIKSIEVVHGLALLADNQPLNLVGIEDLNAHTLGYFQLHRLCIGDGKISE
jgi:hypothetical protein